MSNSLRIRTCSSAIGSIEKLIKAPTRPGLLVDLGLLIAQHSSWLIPMLPNTTLVRSGEPLTARVAEGLVVFSVARGKYYAFDDVTTVIWELLELPMTFAELCRRLQDTFDVPPATCEADVGPLLDEFHERGLVTIVPGAGSTDRST